MRRRRLASILTSASLLGASLGFAGTNPGPLIEAPARTETHDRTPGFVRTQAENGFNLGLGTASHGGAQARVGIERKIAKLPGRMGSLSAGILAHLAPQAVGIGATLDWNIRWRQDQLLLPRLGLRIEHAWRSSGAPGAELGAGPTSGLGLLLSHIDEESAVDFYLKTSVLRTYLMGELAVISAVPAGTLSLRFEY